MVAFVASTVLTAAALNTAFNALTIRTVTGTSDTLVLADNGGAVTYSNASATTSTIPPNSSVAYATGTKIVLVNLGAGVVTVTAGAGVTVNGTLTIAQNAGGTCIKTATNTWSFLPFGSGAPTLTSADVTSTTGSPTITTDGTATVYKFTGDGTIVIGTAGYVAVLMVGGGASGGRQNAGGGGGGAVIEFPSMYLSAATYTISVGAGGAAVSNAAGNDGGTTQFSGISGISTVKALGGGGGGFDAGGAGQNGRTGASGGGAAFLNGTTGGASNLSQIGYGFAGGNCTGSGGGGGGGGAGGVGASSNTANQNVAGGAGRSSTITGSSVTYSAGGRGSSASPATGAANLGDGGGGKYDGGLSGAGGSGVVIVRVG